MADALAGVVRDEEFVLSGSVTGFVSIWEMHTDQLKHSATIRAAIPMQKDSEISSILFCDGYYLAPQGQKAFFAVGYTSGAISVSPVRSWLHSYGL